MKRINYLLLVVFALTMSVTSCKKDESLSEERLSTSERKKVMLTAVSWVKSSYLESGVTAALPDCEKDDVYTFFTDGTVSYQVDELICGGETNGSGTWSLSRDGKALTLDGIIFAMQITDSTLALSLYHLEDDSSSGLTFVPL